MLTTSGATRSAAVVAALAAVVALAACEAASSSEVGGATDPTTSSSSSSHPTDPPRDGCPYLTAQQVTDVLGAPTTETAGTVHACFFDPEGGSGPSVMLSRVDVQIDPADYAAQSKALCQGEVTDVDAGDEAFACVMGLGPQGQLYVNRVLVTLSVNDAADDATGIADAVALLPQVTVPASSG